MCSRSSTTDLAFSQQLVSLNWLPSLPITQHGASRRTCSEYVCGAQGACEAWAITHRKRSETSTIRPIPVPPGQASIYLELFSCCSAVWCFLQASGSAPQRSSLQVNSGASAPFDLVKNPVSILAVFKLKIHWFGGSAHQATLSKGDFVSGLASRGPRLQTKLSKCLGIRNFD